MDVETKQINDLGMITIPLAIRKNLDIKYKDKLEIREQLNINGGDKFDFFVRDNYIIMKKSKTN